MGLWNQKNAFEYRSQPYSIHTEYIGVPVEMHQWPRSGGPNQVPNPTHQALTPQEQQIVQRAIR